MLEKKIEKKMVKTNIETKIFITEIYNAINLCDTIFALPWQKRGKRQRVISFTGSNKGYYSLGSTKKVHACALGIDSKWAVSRSHCTQGMWLFQRSREKILFFYCGNIFWGMRIFLWNICQIYITYIRNLYISTCIACIKILSKWTIFIFAFIQPLNHCY